MWLLDFGPEWAECWAIASAELKRPDRVLGAMEFALGERPALLTKSIAGDRHGPRVLTVTDPISGRPVLFGVRLREMTHTVLVEWVQILANPDEAGPD